MSMDRSVGAAARLRESDRRDLAVQALAGSETVSDLAARHGVSRKWTCQAFVLACTMRSFKDPRRCWPVCSATIWMRESVNQDEN